MDFTGESSPWYRISTPCRSAFRVPLRTTAVNTGFGAFFAVFMAGARLPVHTRDEAVPRAHTCRRARPKRRAALCNGSSVRVLLDANRTGGIDSRGLPRGNGGSSERGDDDHDRGGQHRRCGLNRRNEQRGERGLAQEVTRSSLKLSREAREGATARSFRPRTRHARISDVTHNAVPPTMNVMTTMSQSGR